MRQSTATHRETLHGGPAAARALRLVAGRACRPRAADGRARAGRLDAGARHRLRRTSRAAPPASSSLGLGWTLAFPLLVLAVLGARGALPPARPAADARRPALGRHRDDARAARPRHARGGRRRGRRRGRRARPPLGVRDRLRRGRTACALPLDPSGPPRGRTSPADADRRRRPDRPSGRSAVARQPRTSGSSRSASSTRIRAIPSSTASRCPVLGASWDLERVDRRAGRPAGDHHLLDGSERRAPSARPPLRGARRRGRRSCRGSTRT